MAEQTLTPEAASALNHSQALAKKRGHSHVTPLHVAATLLGFTGSLLQKACISSHPHIRPLHLCFNVALNRLPTISPPPPLHGGAAPLSNSLSAAIKRAQAHKKRTSAVDHRNPPLTPIKVDLQNLIFSILDDPSVSRVMYEAGFSSVSVKDQMNSSAVRWRLPEEEKEEMRWVREEVVGNTLFVGRTQGVVGEAMDEMEKEGRGRVRVIKVEFEEIGGEEVEVVIGVVRKEVEEMLHSGVVLMVVVYIGDLRWVFRDEPCGAPVLVLEGLGRLAAEFDRTLSGFSVSLVATAGYPTYVKWRTVYPYALFRYSFRALSVPRHSVLRLSHYGPHCSKPSPKTAGKPQKQPSSPTSSDGGNSSFRWPSSNFLFREDKETNVTLSLGMYSPSPSPNVTTDTYGRLLGRLVRENLPWQTSAVPDIVRALSRDKNKQRNDTWVLMGGDDYIGKRRLALVIAEAFFGSSASLLHLDLTNRRRQMLTENSVGVVMAEGLVSADPEVLAEVFEGVTDGGGGRIFLAMTGEGDQRREYIIRVRMEAKAKAEEKRKRKRCLERIDLNKKAEEGGEDKVEGEVSPGSSDLTSDHMDDTTAHTNHTNHEWLGFVERIGGGVVLEWKEGEEEWVKEEIEKKVGVEIQGRLLEEMVLVGGSFIGGLLERWVKEVVHSCLDSTVMARTAVRLCFHGRDTDHGLGFMGSCLPLEIQNYLC